MAHDDIRSAPVQQLGELFKVQEMKAVRMCHGSQEMGAVMVGLHHRG
jgi:hypothetical protein